MEKDGESNDLLLIFNFSLTNFNLFLRYSVNNLIVALQGMITLLVLMLNLHSLRNLSSNIEKNSEYLNTLFNNTVNNAINNMINNVTNNTVDDKSNDTLINNNLKDEDISLILN